MSRIHRAAFVCAVLGLSTILSFTNVHGDAGKKSPEPIGLGSTAVKDTTDRHFDEDLAKSKFSDAGVVTYETKDGEKLFALQVKPELLAAEARPRDLVIMVDTSASQVLGGALAAATRLAEELVHRANPQDRIALWTVNIAAATNNLSAGGKKDHGFKAPASDAVKQALEALKNEVPFGSTDLKNGLNRVVQSFDDFEIGGRQRAILFLGDGFSTHEPLTTQDRTKLVDELVKREIAFFPIPLGPRLDPQNLHGLATGTGGKVVRALPGVSVAAVAKNVDAALTAPILYPNRFELTNGDATEYYPTKLPPLRGDSPTLVLGKFKGGLSLGYTVLGVANGKETAFRGNERIRDPELDNFFLVGMLSQWKNAKDQPALMAADRTLAFALEMNQMARTEVLAQAQMALNQDKFDVAGKLFGQAQQLDPNDTEAQGGAKLVMLMKEGKIKREQLREQLAKKDGMALRLEKNGGKSEFRRDLMKNLVALADAQDNKAAPAAPVAPAAPEDKDDLIKKQQQLVKIEEGRVKQLVNDALRQASKDVYVDPEEARTRLKNLLTDVRDNHPDISLRVRQDLVNSITTKLRNVETEGARVKQRQEEQLKLRAIATAQVLAGAKREAVEERTRERMRVFNQLMATARYEDAYRVALEVQQDSVKAGEPVPVAVTAAYDIGLVANNLREVQELKRVREERYLLTMMQVEKSHVPFPDEPPVQYPPAATWQALTKLRKEKYESSGLTDDDPVTLTKIKKLRDLLNRPINQEDFSGPLKEVLSYLGDRYEVPIIVDTEAFKQDLMIAEVETQQVKIPKMSQVSFGTVMRLILAQVQGTYIIRRDFIEVTTSQRQAAEKTIRVYPVADLVIPIPNSVNQQSVNQTVQNSILGAQFGMMGGMGGMGMGGMGMMGMGGMGMMGMGGMGMMGMGGMGMGGALGVAGGGIQGAQGGFQGGGCSGLGFAGGQPINMGVGGGFTGFGGGAMGQFGNLGGQFGIQGGDQSMILITLIRQVIGTPEDWSPLSAFQRKQGGFGEGPDQEEPGVGNPNQAGALGYYPPSRALVVKATSRVHTRLGGGLLGPRQGPPGAGGGAGAALPVDKPGVLVLGDRKKLDPGNPLRNARKDIQVVKNPARNQDPKKKLEALAAGTDNLDPKVIWQDVLEQGVTDPGLIIATADFLVQNKKFDHAAEFLKANLRRGVVVRPWVYEALAITLKEAGGSLADIERSQVSLVDLEPQDAGGYLRASTALAENKHYGQALAFCRQASLLDPNSPHSYAEAMKYAQYARDHDAMEWAAGNILSRDWPVNNQELHDEAKGRLKDLANLLKREQRQGEADQMSTAAGSLGRRDLEIRLSWQGEADLDLEIKEPIGTVCSFMQRQTPGGGILVGDNLAELTRETYVAAEAFSGAYDVTVRKIWGRPLGSRATLEIVQSKGTPQENIRRETIVLDEASQTIKVILDEGRRKSVADVSGAAVVQRPKDTAEKLLTGDQMLTKLRAMADPEFTGQEKGFRGDVGSSGRVTETEFQNRLRSRPAEPITVQGKVAPLTNSLDLTAQATVSADRRFVRLSLAPVFQTANRSQQSPMVSFPVIPGGR